LIVGGAPSPAVSQWQLKRRINKKRRHLKTITYKKNEKGKIKNKLKK
jgi:hypothetical protein